MTVRTTVFDYGACLGGTGVGYSATSWGTASTYYSERLDPYMPATMLATFGRMLLLNSVNTNAQLPFAGNKNNNLAPLLLPTPRSPLTPLLSGFGAGNVFGSDYFWRYRWKNSRTGDVSGLSPLPAFRWNLGVETSPGAGTYLGQTAFFRLFCSITAGEAPAFADSLQLFRNVSGREDTLIQVAEKLFPTDTGAGTTFIDITDDMTDEQLSAVTETAGLNPNPSYDEGTVPPVQKAFAHGTGRVFLYGINRMGPYRTGSLNITLDEYTINRGDTTSFWTQARVGQGLRLLKTSGGTTIDDPTVYRIVQIASTGDKLYVTPAIKTNSQFGSATTLNGVTYEIVDDRDERTLYMSEPNMPTNYDLLKTLYVGFDLDDSLYHVFTMNGVTFAQTKRHLYRLINDTTLDPSLSVQVQLVANEGTVGFWSGAVTPLGWVFLHATLGVRVFDGETIQSLGANNSYEQFLAKTQFLGGEGDVNNQLIGFQNTGFNQSMLSQTRVIYDPQEHLIHVYYVPANAWSISEELVFDPTTMALRGPWRRRATAAGMLKNPGGDEVFVFGDDFGNISIDQQQALDLYTKALAGGSISGGGNGWILVDGTAPFDNSTYQEEGIPVLIDFPGAGSALDLPITPASVGRPHIINVVDGSTLIVEYPNVVWDTRVTSPYTMGAQRWYAVTAFFDAGEPVQPKQMDYLRLRMRVGTSTAKIGVFLSAVTTYGTSVGESGSLTRETINPANTDEPGYAKVRLFAESRVFALEMYGTATTTDPQIVVVIADIDVREGA